MPNEEKKAGEINEVKCNNKITRFSLNRWQAIAAAQSQLAIRGHSTRSYAADRMIKRPTSIEGVRPPACIDADCRPLMHFAPVQRACDSATALS